MRVSTTMELGLMLAERRRELGMTQQEFADHVHVPRLWVAQMETGKTNPKLSRLLDVLRRADLKLNLVGTTDSGVDTRVPVTPPPARPNLDDHLARFTSPNPRTT